ncbi:hypothetical protein AL072_32870 [Azospirillum thiophilum]|uniref:Uncharacterized protein n=1 Tax=Azospirillum thiophilum TaxID=528244 RepID=A0AAC8W5Z5_9PROT|nr:hypothetical protein AL072_32870 [Azospirillum thiophilum]
MEHKVVLEQQSDQLLAAKPADGWKAGHEVLTFDSCFIDRGDEVRKPLHRRHGIFHELSDAQSGFVGQQISPSIRLAIAPAGNRLSQRIDGAYFKSRLHLNDQHPTVVHPQHQIRIIDTLAPERAVGDGQGLDTVPVHRRGGVDLLDVRSLSLGFMWNEVVSVALTAKPPDFAPRYADAQRAPVQRLTRKTQASEGVFMVEPWNVPSGLLASGRNRWRVITIGKPCLGQ